MADITTEPEVQAQAVPEVSEAVTTTPATDLVSDTSFLDAVDQLTTARITGAGADELSRLEALVQSTNPDNLTTAPPAAVEPNEEQTVEPAVEPVEPGEEPETPEDIKVSERPRIKHLSDTDKALVNSANLLAKATGRSFDECWSQVNGKPAAQTQQTQETEHEPVQASPEITQLQGEIAEIEAKLDSAAENGDLFTPEIKDLTRQQSKAYAKLAALEMRSETVAQVHGEQTAQTVQQQRQAILNAAVTDYPGLKNTESEHWQLARDLALAAQNPSHRNHEKSASIEAPRFFAEEAAKLLKIAKASATTTVLPPVSSTPAAQPKIVQPVAGSRQSTPPPPAQTLAERVAASEARTLAAVTGMPAAEVPRGGLRIMIR